MNNKLKILFLLFAFILPGLFMFSACKKEETEPVATEIKVELCSVDYVMTNNTITTTYGSKINLSPTDFKITALLDNGESKILTQKTENNVGYEFNSTVPEDDKTPVGEYVITFGYLNLDNISINVIVEKATIDISNVHWNYESNFVYDNTEKEVTLLDVPTGVQVSYEGTSTAVDAGTYSVIATLTPEDTANYNSISNMELTWHIEKSSLVITPNDVTITYLEDAYDNGYTVTGFANGDDESSLLGEAIYNYGTYESGSNANTYPITISGLTAKNYNITFNNGSLIVNKAVVGSFDTVHIKTSEFTYTGELQTIEIEGIPVGATIKSISGNSGTNAGEYTAVVRFVCSDTTNYEDFTEVEKQFSWKIIAVTTEPKFPDETSFTIIVSASYFDLENMEYSDGCYYVDLAPLTEENSTDENGNIIIEGIETNLSATYHNSLGVELFVNEPFTIPCEELVIGGTGGYIVITLEDSTEVYVYLIFAEAL